MTANKSLRLSNEAIELYQEKQYALSEQKSVEALLLDDKNISALINLGNIKFLQTDYDSALQSYLLADSFRQDYVVSKINLANCYFEKHDFENALSYAKKTLVLDSCNLLALNICGNIALEQDKIEDSILCFSKIVELDSSDAWGYNSLSQAHQKNADFTSAIKAAWQAILLEENTLSHHINFGYLLYETALEKGSDFVADSTKKWLDSYGKNSVVSYMGNALLSSTSITKANPEYLQNIFDIFAPDFEKVLQGLDYRVPDLIDVFLKKTYQDSTPEKMNIIDLGCGTGLCGLFLKNYAQKDGLEGVDLSSKMLDSARAKKLYDNLYCSDIVEFLQSIGLKYDLVVAADVLTYFGPLDGVFEAVEKALKKDGRFVFSISENNLNDKNCFLHISGRFLHSPEYVQNLLEKKGFFVEKISREKLRNEGDEAVFGFIFSGVKRQ